MENRRVHTEEWEYEGLEEEDEDLYRRQMEFYQDSDGEEEQEEVEWVDHNNYKGIYFDDEPGTKFQDPETGAHFDYNEICNRLIEVEVEMRRSQERDKKTMEKNRELLKIDEESDDVYQQNQLFRTEDHTRKQANKAQAVEKRMAEVFSMRNEPIRDSYDSHKLQTNKLNERNSLNIVQTMKNPSIKYDLASSGQK